MREKILEVVKSKHIQKRMLLFVVILIVGVVLVLPKSLAIESQAVKSVIVSSEKLDFENKNEGAWRITESAAWTDKGEAKITFDLETIFRNNLEGTDFIFALDSSSMMVGEKLEGVKNGIREFSDNLLNNPSNKISLISFNSEANVLVDFTDDKKVIDEKLATLGALRSTNYYNALLKINEVLKNYQAEDNRNCVVVFVTGSYPNEGSPNQKTYFKYLKEEYPDVIFNAVQYELGDSVLEQVKSISDYQYIATKNNLSSRLVKFLNVSEVYDEFMVSEYIDERYFNVSDIKNISVNKGNVDFNKSDQKITWNIDSLKSGLGAKMEVTVKLKNEFISQYELYPVSKRIEVNSLIGEDREEVSSVITPILSNNHKVIYDVNVPDGCSPSNVPSSVNKASFEIVNISDLKPRCRGYQFKGWKIVSSKIKKINDSYFTMPDDDVIIRAEWSKMMVNKKMDGKVYKKINLYEQVRLDYQNGKAKKYNGDTDTFTGTQDIYYYYDSEQNNNVVFGNFCWKVVRTTDTGGVKIAYNGEPDSNGRCGTDRENHVGYNQVGNESMSSSYTYGTDYTYDANTKKFTLSGETETVLWNDLSYQGLIGKYTCKNTTGSCDNLYYIDSYHSSSEASVFMLSSDILYSYIGISAFGNTSFSSLGYMYNREYYRNTKTLSSDNATNDYMYGNSFTYNQEKGMYTLSGFTQHFYDWEKNYNKLSNSHYTCWNSSGTCKTISYIYNIYNKKPYYIELDNGESIEIALEEMLSADDINKKDSVIKRLIDLWYFRNMMKYTNYLEDTVWCNNRSINDLGGFNPNGGSNSFGVNIGFTNGSVSLTCPSRNDRFTVSSKNGNGALAYPVGLPTIQEFNLTGNKLFEGQYRWSLSPYGINHTGPRASYSLGNGSSTDSFIHSKFGVSPSISLKSGVGYGDGDGSTQNPYVIITE